MRRGRGARRVAPSRAPTPRAPAVRCAASRGPTARGRCGPRGVVVRRRRSRTRRAQPGAGTTWAPEPRRPPRRSEGHNVTLYKRKHTFETICNSTFLSELKPDATLSSHGGQTAFSSLLHHTPPPTAGSPPFAMRANDDALPKPRSPPVHIPFAFGLFILASRVQLVSQCSLHL